MNRHERETYDSWLDRNSESAGDCPVCDGGNGEACGPECDAIMKRAARRDKIRGLRRQAEVALTLAKAYRVEQGPGSDRERACLDVVAGCRLRIRALRSAS